MVIKHFSFLISSERESNAVLTPHVRIFDGMAQTMMIDIMRLALLVLYRSHNQSSSMAPHLSPDDVTKKLDWNLSSSNSSDSHSSANPCPSRNSLNTSWIYFGKELGPLARPKGNRSLIRLTSIFSSFATWPAPQRYGNRLGKTLLIESFHS